MPLHPQERRVTALVGRFPDYQTAHARNSTPSTACRNVMASCKRGPWLLSYLLEDCRQNAAAHSRFWREAGACIALAVLRIGRAA